MSTKSAAERRPVPAVVDAAFPLPIHRKGTAAVYRHFDVDGVLLYVGCDADPRKRNLQHARKPSAWFACVDRITVEWYPTRVEADAVEKAAITTEAPVYNVVRHRRSGDGCGRRPGWTEFTTRLDERMFQMVADHAASNWLSFNQAMVQLLVDGLAAEGRL